MTKVSAPNDNIQFIPAEELKRLAELEREENFANSTEGMIDDTTKVYNQLGGVEFMAAWASARPSEFFRLRAKLLSDKDRNNVSNNQHIYIGLPKTELDG